MRTNWPGLVLPSDNMLLEEVYFEASVLFTLSDTPSVATAVHMPDFSRGVQLRSIDATVWYGVDQLPGPIPPTLVGVTDIGADAFRPGGVLFPNEQKALSFMNTGGLHIVYLISEAQSPLVVVTALKETP